MNILEKKQYSPKDIKEAAIIMHPSSKGYNIKADEIAHLFEEGSNFIQLDNPIYDEYGNEFWDSEGYYMASRTKDLATKKMIAFMSIGYGVARNARRKYPLDKNKSNRVEYMREAIKLKFDNNPRLRELLMQTGEREIIEYTFWGDTFFGIDQKTLKGQNVLGKLLMEYRNAVLQNEL